MRTLDTKEIEAVSGGSRAKKFVKAVKAVAIALLETNPAPTRYGSDGWRP